MRAVGYIRYGGPEVLEIYDLPEIHAGPGQLRIRNYAATVNPTDIMARSGMLSGQQKGFAPPYVPGMEAAGVVDEVGEGVTTDGEHFPDGVDGLADGAVLNDLVIPAVRDGGAFTSVRGFEGEPQRGIRFSRTFVTNYDGEFDKLDRLRQQVEDRTLSLRLAATYPKEEATAAHERLEAGGTRGRLVIEF